jgi:tetratricopeptide (TPR) repeat protein
MPLLSRVLEADGRLAGHLRDLHALDFVFPNRTEPEPVYSFKHALTQEVAYGGLLERRRRSYHAAVGRAIEELYGGRLAEVVELLAYQFGRSAEDDKAVDYAILAAEKAQRRWADTEALRGFAVALTRLETMPDTPPNRLRRIDAVVKQSEMMFALGRHAEHVQSLEAIREMVETIADPARRAAWYFWAGFLHSIVGTRPEVPTAYCRAASAIAEASGLEELRAFAQCALTQAYNMAGDFQGTLDAGEKALTIFEAQGNTWWACRTLWALGVAAMYLGQWPRSLDYCRRSLEHGRTVDDLRLKVVGWWRTGWTHIQRGDAATGIRCCDEALALGPIPFDAAMARAAKGYGLIKAGQEAAGTALLAEAVAWLGESRLQLTRAQFALCLADGYLRQGERSRGRAIVEEVLQIAIEGGYRHHEGIAHRLLGELLTAEDPTAAAAHLDAALTILEQVGARHEFAKTLVAQADLRRLRGDPADAHRLLERALTLFEDCGSLDWPPRVREALTALAATASPRD